MVNKGPIVDPTHEPIEEGLGDADVNENEMQHIERLNAVTSQDQLLETNTKGGITLFDSPNDIDNEQHVDQQSVDREQQIDQDEIELEEDVILEKNASKKSKKKDKEFIDAREPKSKFPFRLVLHIGLDWIWVLFASFFAIGAGIAPVFFYVVFQDLVDTIVRPPGSPPITADELEHETSIIALKMLGIAAAVGLAEGMKQFFLTFAQHRFNYRIKSKYYNSLMRQEMAYFDIKKTGDLLAHLSEDTAQIVEAWTTKTTTVIQFLCQALVGIILSFRASWLQTLVMASIIPLFVIGVGIGGTCILAVGKKATDASASSIATASEVIGSMRTVRSMAGEERERRRFKKNLTNFAFISYLKAVVNGFAMFGGHFAIWASVALSFFFGGILITEGIEGEFKISVGKMFEVFGVSLFAVIAVGQAAAEGSNAAKVTGSAVALQAIIDRKPQITPWDGKVIPSENLKGNISIENLTFRYPSRPNVVVMKDFSLKINSGTHVALVGESGSGKSTIVSLIEKFYIPDKGKILIDGYDLASLDPYWWRKIVGIVTQEPVLFNMTIEENIKYGVIRGDQDDKEITKDDVIAAAKAANAHDFIMNFKDGYSTIVGERGTQLSGGQKQRVCIARTLLQDPKILLLDEATSALDVKSEGIVQEALNHLMQGRTSIVIAHRLSTVVDCDHIVVMSSGKIIEQGTHSELLNKKGAYYALAEKQMKFGQDATKASETMVENHEKKDESHENEYDNHGKG